MSYGHAIVAQRLATRMAFPSATASGEAQRCLLMQECGTCASKHRGGVQGSVGRFEQMPLQQAMRKRTVLTGEEHDNKADVESAQSIKDVD